jgi:branched-chain amino acid transport system substrate-binding protein
LLWEGRARLRAALFINEGQELMTMKRTISVGLLGACLVFAGQMTLATGQYGPGVTDTEIKIGQTYPYSGPASAYGIVGKAQAAYVRMINEHGGIR